MKIVIAGGAGFLGRPLSNALIAAGHDVVLLSRGSATAGFGHVGAMRTVAWNPDGSTGPWASDVDGAGVVVSLAGEPIAAKRWTSAQKQRILDSRVLATQSLVAAIRRAASPPSVFVSGSAVGYYGPLGDERATENTPAGSDFLAQVCVQWEAEALRAASLHTRVVCIRTGVVLERDGGALPQMVMPFKLFAGGPVGSGRQYLPWIHRDDWIAIVVWAMQTTTVSGAVNATAPTPVTNADFAHALGRALHRPSFVPAPAFALRWLLGEMADALLLSGQRAVPAVAEQAGFAFRYARVDDALAAILTG
jgi:uncharacterized protein (TIGR01777 family)